MRVILCLWMDRENFKHANSVGGVHKFSYVLHVGLELWCCEFSVAMRQMFGSNLNKFYVLLPLAQSSSRVLFTINVLQHRHGIGCYFWVNSAFNINGSTVNTKVTGQKYQRQLHRVKDQIMERCYTTFLVVAVVVFYDISSQNMNHQVIQNSSAVYGVPYPHILTRDGSILMV